MENEQELRQELPDGAGYSQRIVMNWKAIAPILLMNIANRGAVFMQDEAVKEIMKMARAADKWNEHVAAQQENQGG